MKRSLLGELKRRNVLRAAALYLASAWLVVQIVTQIFPVYSLPAWTMRWVIGALAFGFPFWIAFAWFYELTPEGLRRESEIDPTESITHRTGRRLDLLIIVILAIAVVLLLTNTFVWREGAGLRAADSEPVPARSIAVLPFTNMSDDKQQDYFADGISEDLLNLLAKAQPLQVAARTSSFSFKGKQLGIPEIARTLHVANVLEGSVRKAGDEVRITAQLIRASDGYEIWSQRFDRRFADIFAIQDEIAADVVAQLKIKLLDAVPTARQTDPRAYALYLEGRQFVFESTVHANEQAEVLLRQALAIDSHYAPAWTELSRDYLNETVIGLLKGKEGMQRAREAAEKAVVSDPDYAPAHALLGRIAIGQGDLASAARHLERALVVDSSDLDVLRTSAVLLAALGRLKEATAIDEYSVVPDPVNVRSLYNLGVFYRMARRFDEAIAKFHTVLSLSPGYGIARLQLGVAMLQKNDASAAQALAEMQQSTSELWRLNGLPMAYHALGRKADSDATLAQLIEKYQKEAPYDIACVYAYRDEADKVFEWLDRAVEYDDASLAEITTESLFDNIHHDARWLPFLRRIGKAPDQLAKIEFKVALPHQAAGQQSSTAQSAH